MKVELTCVKKQQVTERFIEIRFKCGSMELTFNASRKLADTYEIGKTYYLALEDTLEGLAL